MDCEHQWDPISSWIGRYRCARCDAIAYKHIVLPNDMLNPRRTAEITPYKCQEKGCGKNAVYIGRKSDKKFCKAHWEKRRAKFKG